MGDDQKPEPVAADREISGPNLRCFIGSGSMTFQSARASAMRASPKRNRRTGWRKLRASHTSRSSAMSAGLRSAPGVSWRRLTLSTSLSRF